MKNKPVLSDSRRLLLSGSILLWQMAFTACSIWMSLSEKWFFWLPGQFLLGISLLQWFFLEHDLGHGRFVPHKWSSHVMGHVSSVFTLIPYLPWQQVHHAHHRWTGWREKDPTIPDKEFENMPPAMKRLIDFCWKYWVPLLALGYCLQTFWNLKRLNQLFPDARSNRRNAFSVWFLLVVYLFFFLYLGLVFIKIWLLAFLVYLSISDPYLLSQHTHLDGKDIKAEPLKPVRFLEQDKFTRTVRFPRWVEKYVFYNSNSHGFHHQYPWLAVYEIHHGADEQLENVTHWREWLRIAKGLPGHVLIFQSYKHSGVKL